VEEIGCTSQHQIYFVFEGNTKGTLSSFSFESISPNEYCTLLLQSALKRKAGETSSNYEEFQSHFESI
jgi:hypothetical protein